jgi:hypothetical protein
MHACNWKLVRLEFQIPAQLQEDAIMQHFDLTVFFSRTWLCTYYKTGYVAVVYNVSIIPFSVNSRKRKRRMNQSMYIYAAVSRVSTPMER